MSYQPLCPAIYQKLLEEQQKGNSFLQPTSSSYSPDIIFDPVEYMEARGYYPPYTSADLFQGTISPYIEHGGFLDIGLDQKTNEKLSSIPLDETKIIFDTLVWSSSAASSWRGTIDDMQSNSVLELNGKHYPVISAVMPLVTFLHTFFACSIASTR